MGIEYVRQSISYVTICEVMGRAYLEMSNFHRSCGCSHFPMLKFWALIVNNWYSVYVMWVCTFVSLLSMNRSQRRTE